MKVRDQRSRGMEALITEALDEIKSTDPLKIIQSREHRNRNHHSSPMMGTPDPMSFLVHFIIIYY